MLDQLIDVKVGIFVKRQYFKICCFHNLFSKWYIVPLRIILYPLLRGKFLGESSPNHKNIFSYNNCPQKCPLHRGFSMKVSS